jgi:3-oxoacyl-[acyl-carrier protein] reductase
MIAKCNQVALISGASSGIGRALALGLAGEGYQVCLLARTGLMLSDVCKEIEPLVTAGVCPVPEPIELDIGEVENVRSAVERVVDRCGSIDILINNAGIVRRGTASISGKDLTEVFQTNFFGAYHLINAVAPIMRSAGNGHIINISSRSGIFPKAKNGGYAASKAALRIMSAALYQELASNGIKVATILPSYVDTPQSSGQAWLPRDKMIRPEDIFSTVKYILSLSPSASVMEIMIEATEVVANGERYQ